PGGSKRQDELPGPERDLLDRSVRPCAGDDDGPPVTFPDGRLAGRGVPVAEFQALRVHLEPVADLVLRREHRPARRERNVGQVVVPDWVVQREGLVALAPRVTRSLVALEDDRRDPKLAQPRTQRD